MLYLKILILFEMDFGLDFCYILIRMTNFFLFSFLLSFFFLLFFVIGSNVRKWPKSIA